MATQHTATHTAAASTSSEGMQRAGVMSRLHSLFPTSSLSTSQDASLSPLNTTDTPLRPAMETPKFIKIRMLTWNMYDSLPKGDLEELLGSARPLDPTYIPPDEDALPDLPADSDHPYHLVVVACQECPTVSGIPRGLGAPEFKRKERDKDKKDKDRERDDIPERPHSRQQLLPESDKGKDSEEKEPRERPRSMHRFNIHREHSQHRISRDDMPSSANISIHSDHAHQAYGWSAMLEDWYVHGKSYDPTIDPGPSKRPLLDVPIGDELPRIGDSEIVMSPKAKSTGDLNARMDAKTSYKGPYELLVKERMMGLYLAVYIKRDIRGLVRGTSKSSVTAGLIGGRVGNKGAIGVSINLDGKTFLFINAHLAAHDGKMHHRLANLTKIQTELSVDSFLTSDDPRLMAEDLTERFDHTFFCGDLNFRLDITRLHADWLISRKEYAQALAFDQLRKVMASGEAFVGFQEGQIDFPPTFKYDVLRTTKRSKHSLRRPAKAVVADPGLHEKVLSEIEEQEREEREALMRAEDEDDEDGGEATSITSSAWTSVHSRQTEDPDDRDADDDEADEYFFSADTAATTRANANIGNNNVVQKILTASAAHKAKAKWMSLIQSPNGSPWSKMKKKLDSDHSQPPPSPSFAFRSATLLPTPGETPGTSTAHVAADSDDKFLKPLRSHGSGRISPIKSRRKSDEEEPEDPDKGVYDSSHKQRVPSWCDRILWKSTVEPQPYDVWPLEEPLPTSPPRTRIGHLFHALRPGMRNRKDSYASTVSAESMPISPATSDTESSDTSHHLSSSPRFLVNNPHPPARPSRLSRSQSNDSMTIHERPITSRSFTHAPGHETNTRPVSSPPSSLPPPPPPPPPKQQLPYAVYKPRHGHHAAESPTLPHPPETNPSPSEVPPPLPPKDLTSPSSHRWLSNFLPFLSRDYTSQPCLPLELPPTPEPTPPPLPRKGEIACLEYRTLDDKGMRRLEGRSDHRPVIGSYAVYI
ncbi:hypothetical protein EIP91_004970 [Steccherinum ochraceum]|uniref:Inositol polyphosphate-related phosphatase domain-containing protein n=1 Tax=Steccherinum ochraceum TaxID=92696 RepID=A0A4R0RDZ0_9APHY|nr:hypothetical protein EIP91_004970 [Steccherinum ochraceum]